MRPAAEETFALPSRGQQVAAWLAVAVILGAIVWMTTSILRHWHENQTEIDALEARVSTLRMQQGDPAPLMDLLAQSKSAPIAALGYVEGASEDEARSRIEQAVSALLSTHQAQVLSFARLPTIQNGPVRGLPFEITLMAPTSKVVPFVAAIERAPFAMIMRKLSLERRADGLANVTFRGEAYWVAP